MALALQAALLVQHAPACVSDAFCQSRLAQIGQHNYGSLPRGVDAVAIIARATPQGESLALEPAGARRFRAGAAAVPAAG